MAVDLLAPDGTPGSAPESEVPRLLELGYKPQSTEAPAVEIEAPAPDPTEGVNLVAPDGTIGSAPASEVSRLLSLGYSPASDDVLQRDRERQFNESALGLAATAGEQLTQGATLGLYGLGMGLADEGYRERMDNRAADNPGTALGANVAGAVLPSLLTGGAGVAGSLARATPAGIVEGIGSAAGQALTTRLGGQAAARIAGMAAAGAVEGALGNSVALLANEFPQIAQDPGGVAEHLLASASEGLFIGGAMGGALGGLSEGLGALSRSIEGRALRQAEEAAKRAAEVPKVDESNFDQVVLDLEAKPLTSAEQLAQGDARNGILRQLDEVKAAEGGFEDAVQVGTREIESEMNKVFTHLDDIDEDAGIAAKIKEIARRQAGDVDVMAVTDSIGSIERRLDSVAQEFGDVALADGGGLAAIKKVKGQINHALKKINEHVTVNDGVPGFKSGSAGEIFVELDQLKRVTQRLAKNTQNRIVQEVLRDETEVFRQFLQSEGVWGPLADMQRAVNEPWSNRFLKQGDSRVQGFTVSQSGDRARDLYETVDRANGSAIKGLLANLGDAGQEGQEKAFRELLRAQAKDAATRAGVWGTPELKKKAVEVVQSIAKIEKRLDDVARIRADAIKGQRALQPSALQSLAASAPFAGVAINGVVQLKRSVLRAVSDTAGQTQIKAMNAAARLVKGAGKAAGSSARVAPRAAVATRRALEQEIQAAQELQDPSSPKYQALLREATDMENAAPGLGAAYMQSAQQRAAFVTSKLPVPPSSAIFGPAPKLDPISERKMRKYIGAAYAPTAALDRIATGRGSFEDVETVRTLYPRIYETFTNKVADLLSQMKNPPNLETRIKISMATGLEVDPTIKNVGKYQQFAQSGLGAQAEEQAQGPQQPAQQGPAPIHMGGRSPDEVYAAPMDRVLNRM